MKKLLFTAAALLLVLMTACTAMAVDAGTYTWNGHSIEVVEAATGGMFAPAGMTADEYCVTVKLTVGDDIKDDDEALHALYADALLADPQGQTYAPGTWLSSDAGHSFLYAIPKSIAAEDLTLALGGSEAAGDAGAEAAVPEELTGSWHGTGTPKGGGPSIDLSAAINADGTGDYTFIQSGYTESYPFTISSEDNTFSVNIPSNNMLGISKCEGTYTYADGVLHLDITTTFANGRTYSYTAECTKAE